MQWSAQHGVERGAAGAVQGVLGAEADLCEDMLQSGRRGSQKGGSKSTEEIFVPSAQLQTMLPRSLGACLRTQPAGKDPAPWRATHRIGSWLVCLRCGQQLPQFPLRSAMPDTRRHHIVI